MAYLSGIIILTFFRRHDHMKISTYVECSTLEFVCGSVETFGCHDEVFVVLVVVGCSCKNVQPAVQQTKPNTSIFYWVFACFSYLQPTHNQPHVCEKYGQVLFTEQTEKPPAAGNWVWGEMGKMLVLTFILEVSCSHDDPQNCLTHFFLNWMPNNIFLYSFQNYLCGFRSHRLERRLINKFIFLEKKFLEFFYDFINPFSHSLSFCNIN